MVGGEAVTFTNRLAQFFRDRPGCWIDGRELATVAGSYAWRSRVSDCRRELGMPIENRIRRIGNLKISEYRYLATGAKISLDTRQREA